MKLFRRIMGLTVALAVLMTLAVPLAAGQEGYKYTVRIFAGQQGAIVDAGENSGMIAEDGNVLICEGLPYGQQIIFNNKMVSVNKGSQYYVKGIRESGKGTDEVSETGSSRRDPAFSVDRDQDYVVVYGVLTNPVQYTVNYQDASGRELAPSETYYGNVGDRPVVAYLYIEGYQPQAYNLTRTLSEDPAENVFPFVYSPLPENNVFTEQTTIVETEPTPEPGGGTETPGGETTPEAGGEPGPGTAPAPEENIPDNETPAANPEQPLQSWNLDDGEVPLAGFDGTDSDLDRGGILGPEGAMFWNRIPLAAKIAGGVVMLGGFSVAVWLLIYRRRRKGDQ